MRRHSIDVIHWTYRLVITQEHMWDCNVSYFTHIQTHTSAENWVSSSNSYVQFIIPTTDLTADYSGLRTRIVHHVGWQGSASLFYPILTKWHNSWWLRYACLRQWSHMLKITFNIYYFHPDIEIFFETGDFSLMKLQLEPLVFFCVYQHWVMIHMLVRDGQRSIDACWPVREMWQLLTCGGEAEQCSLQLSIAPGASWDAHGEPSSLSFISFFIFHSLCLSSFPILNTSTMFFSTLDFFFFTLLLSHGPCRDLSTAHGLHTLT